MNSPIPLAQLALPTVGRMVIDSVWQFALVGFIVWGVLLCVRRAQPQVRYVVALLGLLALPLLGLCSLNRHDALALTARYPEHIALESVSPSVSVTAAANSTARRKPVREAEQNQAVTAPPHQRASTARMEQRVTSSSSGSSTLAGSQFATAASNSNTMDSRLDASIRDSAGGQPHQHELRDPVWLVGIAIAWLAGVLGQGLWHLVGYSLLLRMRRVGVRPVSEPLRAALDSVLARLQVRRPVAIAESVLVRVPIVVGWLRPLVLLPIGMTSGLSWKQVESILAHEVTHIRRRDVLVNLVQAMVETVFFYHPVTWWISNRIRTERELCCDDAAVAVSGSQFAYAQALLQVARCSSDPRLAVALTGARRQTETVKRIKRLIGQSHSDGLRPARAFSGLSLLLVLGITMTQLADAEPFLPQNPPDDAVGPASEAESPKQEEPRQQTSENGAATPSSLPPDQGREPAERELIYRADAGTLPIQHGFRLISDRRGQKSQIVRQGGQPVLQIGPSSRRGRHYWYANPFAMSFDAAGSGVVVEWVAKTVKSPLVGDPGWHRAAFGVHVTDEQRRAFYVYVAADQICLANHSADRSPAFTPKLDSTSRFHHYRLVIENQRGLLYVDGNPRPALVREMGDVDSADVPANSISVGDLTLLAGGTTQLQSIAVANWPQARPIPFRLADVLPPAPSVTLNYEAKNGTLPFDTEYQLVSTDRSTAAPRFHDGLLQHGPTSTEGLNYWYTQRVPIDFRHGALQIDCTAQVRTAMLWEDPNSTLVETGFSLEVTDGAGQQVRVLLAEDRVGLDADGDEAGPIFTRFQTTDRLHDYQLKIEDQQVRLFVDGRESPLLTMVLKESGRTKLQTREVEHKEILTRGPQLEGPVVEGPAGPPSRPPVLPTAEAVRNEVAFGDLSTHAGGEVLISSVSMTSEGTSFVEQAEQASHHDADQSNVKFEVFFDDSQSLKLP